MPNEREKQKQGTQNDLDGVTYQLMVRDYLEDLTGEFGDVNIKQGIDVICKELKVEVKGAKSITTKSNTLWGYRWKSFRQWIPYIHEGLTHFCFVVEEKDFNSVPLLYFLSIEKIQDLVSRHQALRRKSQWLSIPFLYIKLYYDRKLSRVD